MNKKVLIISSSPRKGGNSDTLCDQFKLGADESGNITEKVFLKDKTINYCTGCGYCTSNNKKGCAQKDDMSEILEKMIAADVIAMATPIYFYTMNGQMKTFIDRVCSKYTAIKNKDFYFIMTAADTNKQALERAVEEFRGFTSCLDNIKEKGIIYATGVWNVGDVKKTDLMDKAYNMGKSI
ncbi:MAG: flavodoxin family protein [Alphaproteobacteria bacterium]